MLAKSGKRDSNVGPTSPKLSENQGVAIVSQSLEDTAIEEKKELSDSDIVDSSSPEPREAAAENQPEEMK